MMQKPLPRASFGYAENETHRFEKPPGRVLRIGEFGVQMMLISTPCEKDGRFLLVLTLRGRLQRRKAGYENPFSTAC
jgi:hypothetical protein